MKPVKLERSENHSHSRWWDSHLSPRHSRWLKENLADMDLKVKDMMKLIQDDADSFAKRAEMYYKKRPELVSLVEEFYRAYRALAERYDRITGELHHVQCSMGDAFPDNLQSAMDNISPRSPFRNKQSLSHVGKELESVGAVVEDTGCESLENKETPCIEPSIQMDKRIGSSAQKLDSDEITKLQREILSLCQENKILERDCEKEVQNVRLVEEQLLQMQKELHHVQEENHKLIEGSTSYMAQINELKEQVSMLKRQNDEYAEHTKAMSHKLQSETQEKNKLIIQIQSLEAKLNISDRQTIQTELNYECSTPDHENNGENFANLQDELFKLHHENHSLRMQVMTGVQQLQKANEEIQKLHQALLKSQAENDTMIFQYQQSLKLYESAENRAKDLQLRMAHVQEENRRIRDEISGGVLSMKITEERAHNLERENNAFLPNNWHRIERTDLLQGLRAKQDKEQTPGTGNLDETSQIFNFDTVLKNCLQSLTQSQDQQNKLSAELHSGNERLKNADKRIKLLEEEINNLQMVNHHLMEKSSSAVMSVKNLEQEIYKLKQEKNNLLNEVAFRVDQRDALQQELYCLKEDRNDLDRKFQMVMKQIESLGLDAESIHSVFVSLQYIRQKLREQIHINEDENMNVPHALQKMEELLNKTVILESSVLSHRLEAERFECEMKLLQQYVQDLQQEKAELTDKSRQQNDRIGDLDAKLENVHNLYSQLERESQQHKDELADSLECLKHLEEQICSFQGEKETLKNEIAGSNLQMSYSQEQVDLLKGEVKHMRNKLEEEINIRQMLEIEIKKLQQIICEMDNRNQTLSDDYHKVSEKYSAAEEKVNELEATISKQQSENDMLLQNFSSAIEFNRELELEIENLQKLVGISYNVEGKVGNADGERRKMLKSIIEEVKNLQKELSHFQGENEKLIQETLVKTKHLEQLQKDMSVLCSEKESIKEEAAHGLENLMSLQKEKSQLQEATKSLRTDLEAGMEREKSLEAEIQILKQSLTSSFSEHLALEGEYQTILEEHNSIKACLKDSEHKILEMELENQTLLIEALSQVSLISMLESLLIEKDENTQLMEKQLNSFQETNVKLEYWLQSCGSKPKMQEAEIMCKDLEENTERTGTKTSSLRKGCMKKNVCSFTEEDSNVLSQKEAQNTDIHKHQDHWQRQFEDDVVNLQGRGTGMNCEVETQAHNNNLRQSDMPAIYPVQNEIKETCHSLKDECQHRSKELCDAGACLEDIENNNMQQRSENKIPMFHEERMLKDKFQSQVPDVDALNVKIDEINGLETQKVEAKSEEALLPVPALVSESGARNEVQESQSQIAELQNIVKDLQQANIELKCQRWKNSAGDSIMGKGYQQVKYQNSKLMLLEGPSDDQEEKEVLVDEVRGETSIEDKVKQDICCLEEQNQKLWTRFESATQRFHKLQITFQELQEKFWKTRQDNKKAKADGQSGKQNNAIEKQFGELQDDLLLWLECNDMLTKEVQYRFASANRLQSELAATSVGHSGEIEFAFSQTAKLEKEVQRIQEQNSKIADGLRAGSDQARGLEFEVEKFLLKFQREKKTSMTEQHKKAYMPRVRTSLRVFLFGKEEHKQKQIGGCACMQPATSE